MFISNFDKKHFFWQVLEEIRLKDVVEETIAPVFSIQLVLNVPGTEKANREERKRHRRHKSSGKSGLYSGGKTDSASTRKTVQFQDLEEESGQY